MEAHVRKWGNSLAVRIPRSFAEEVGIHEGTEIDLHITENGLTITPKKREALNLASLMEKMNDNNIHGEIDFGQSEGSENL